MQNIDAIKELAQSLAVPFFENEPMSRHTTFQIGGPADIYLAPASGEGLSKILELCREREIPVFVMGCGSNLLVSDSGIRGAVIQTGGAFSQIEQISACELECGAGARLSRLCTWAMEHSLSGLEFAWGIPGTVGGAAYMNAGAYDGEFKSVALSCQHISPEGEPGRFVGEELRLGYRHSVYSLRAKKSAACGSSAKDTAKSVYSNGDYVITSVRVLLNPGEQGAIRAKMDGIMNRRKEKQPLEFPSAGSVFKRPKGNFAGTLIEQCGLKGLTVGGARVSEKHAGFIVNTGGATCADVLELIDKIKQRVFLQTSVELECEIKIPEA
ncbi:MAG: UDP-N-acetylmuramate dehydrogenase [Oscillospiraceae bacterium]|nr:UDP-N-acetylmuramate dehydrogenase [Oscillospiraceae bacterium]